MNETEDLSNEAPPSYLEPNSSQESSKEARRKELLVEAHRLLWSSISDFDPHRSKNDNNEDHETNSDRGGNETESDNEDPRNLSESELLSMLEEDIKVIRVAKVGEIKIEEQSHAESESECNVWRVPWSHFVRFPKENSFDLGPLVAVHGPPADWTENFPDYGIHGSYQLFPIFPSATADPGAFSPGPTERVYLVHLTGPVAELLKETLQLRLNHDDLAMFWPFKRLYSYEENIREVLLQLNRDKDVQGTGKKLCYLSRKIKLLRPILSFIDCDLAPLWRRYQTPGKECLSVRFEELWLVFRPGDICFAPVSSTLRAKMEATKSIADTDAVAATPTTSHRYQETWRVLCTSGGQPLFNVRGGMTALTINPFKIRCYYIDFDGTSFFPVVHDFQIHPFKGEVFISSLAICPSRFLADGKDIETGFCKSGELFRDITRFKPFYYSEKTLVGHPCGCSTTTPNEQISEYVEGPVVVDFREALRSNPGWHINNEWTVLSALEEDQDETSQKMELLGESLYGVVHTFIYDRDHELDQQSMEKFISSNKLLKRFQQRLNTTFEDLDTNDLCLLPPRVFGFVLRSRKFVSLKVNHLKVYERSSDGFDNLKLPSGHKKLIRSLVIHHMSDMDAQLRDDHSHDYDIVRGKGKGLIALLHGAPGVGKTSTAECVAAASGRVLFPITCGDLGVEASQVEKELEQKFHLAQRWNCVLLLDEADVFLTQRSRSDINHNSLVSVFLRRLEYYTGILFLTTNRVGAFDMAFKSRIHISLYYPPLREKETMQIWKMNLDALQERKKDSLSIAIPQILQFAKAHYLNMKKKDMQWNGRQIRNAVQTAVALAEYEYLPEKKKGNQEPCKLLPAHFEIVASTAEQFDDHLANIYGAGEDERAFNRMDRAKKGQVINPFKSRYGNDYITPTQGDSRGVNEAWTSSGYISSQARARGNTFIRGTEWYVGGKQDDYFEEGKNFDNEVEPGEEDGGIQHQIPNTHKGFLGLQRGDARGRRRGRSGRGEQGGQGCGYLPNTEPIQRRRGVSPNWNTQEAGHGDDDGDDDGGDYDVERFRWDED